MTRVMTPTRPFTNLNVEELFGLAALLADFFESGLRRFPIPRSGLISGRTVVSSAPSLEVFCRKYADLGGNSVVS